MLYELFLDFPVTPAMLLWIVKSQLESIPLDVMLLSYGFCCFPFVYMIQFNTPSCVFCSFCAYPYKFFECVNCL